MRARLNIILLFAMFSLLCSCASNQIASPQITIVNNAALNFTGRGSAAAFMLDGLLDGGGMAVGIAIDQGIAKDIAKNLNSLPQGFSIEQLVLREWNKAVLENKLPQSKRKLLENLGIKIHTYGFKAATGVADKVVPWLKIEFQMGDIQKTLEYPIDTLNSNIIGFDQVKSDAIVANAALEFAVAQVIHQFLSNL